MNKTTEPASIRLLLEQATRLLTTDSPQLDAEVLLAHALDQPRSHLRAWPEKIPSTEQLEDFQRLLQTRLQGEPVAYLTGQREFWSLPLTVTPATLIPRPETETLVALALERIPKDRRTDIADLGTGSGAIALAIAHERPGCRMLATDTSAAAIETATANAVQLGIRNIEFLCGDWCTPLQGRQFDVIASNPPYIKDTDPHLQQGDVRFEPHTALAAGPQGMDELTKIAHCARQYLRTGGWLLMEHGYDQRDAVTQLLTLGGFSQVVDYQDDTGVDRVIVGRR